MLTKNYENLKIGVFGGTFNPPHIGHIQALQGAIEQMLFDRLIIVPGGFPPHKKLPDNTPSPKSRLEMTNLAFMDTSDIVTISDMEVFLPQPAFTVDTVSKIKMHYPNSSIYLLMGTDMYLTIETWKDASRLIDMIVPTVFARTENDNKRIHRFSEYFEKEYGITTVIIKNEAINISSSKIRKALPKRSGSQFLTDSCYGYIVKNSLYKVKTDLNWLRSKAYLMLKHSRISHVQYCEEAAESLAIRWGADSDEAIEAAILHDITKNFSKCQHLEILNHNNIIFDIEDINVVKLLHPLTGALIAENEFSASHNVTQAIRWHTTGKPNMSLLEKVIYIADFIESTRDFPEVDTLRKLAYDNLDDAMIMGLSLTIEEIKTQGLTPNELSINALHDLLT